MIRRCWEWEKVMDTKICGLWTHKKTYTPMPSVTEGQESTPPSHHCAGLDRKLIPSDQSGLRPEWTD